MGVEPGKTEAKSESSKPVTRRKRSRFFFLRQLIVNRPLQLMLLCYSVAIVILTSVFLLGVTFSYANSDTDYFAFERVLILGFLLFAMIFLVDLWISNKIAGPIYRLEMHMKGLLDGEPIKELQIRTGDHFQSTVDLYNQLLKRLENSGEKK